MQTRLISTFLAWVIAIAGFSQNLVPNGSFEEGTNCPSFIGNFDEECLDWYSSIQYTDGSINPTPEWYFNCGDAENLMPPNVAFGFQEPLDGEGYAGVIILLDQFGVEESYREPIGVQLIEPLVTGNNYLVEFSIVRLYSQATTLAANNFGFKFTNVPVFSHDSLLIDNTATFKIDTIVSDTTNWLTISTEIVADSNYSFVHFGNFFDNANTEFIANTDIGIYAYLALDAVSITEVLSTNDARGASLSVYPNPASQYVSLESAANEIRTVKILSLLGEVVFEQSYVGQKELSIDVSGFAKGLYLVKVHVSRNEFSTTELFIR
ncbi:T9SS type A sorting domain-containing protein [Cryomorphaceae bacterium 1068]|nr:T9SS type A sorting domain-containing protein [Cryomorphaceae bacterium 1068]